MPVLHRYSDGNGYYVLTSIHGKVVTFQLTSEGYVHLQSAGVAPGKPFNRFLLLDVYRMGQAFTGHAGAGFVPGQGALDFPDDPEPESMFPSCSACSSHDDLHLVEIKDRSRHCATILCTTCRARDLACLDTSIPLPFVTRAVLSRLMTLKDISEADKSVSILQELLNAEFSEKWKLLAETRGRKRTQGLLIDDKSSDRLV
jgi:hypothetical protein